MRLPLSSSKGALLLCFRWECLEVGVGDSVSTGVGLGLSVDVGDSVGTGVGLGSSTRVAVGTGVDVSIGLVKFATFLVRVQ